MAIQDFRCSLTQISSPGKPEEDRIDAQMQKVIAELAWENGMTEADFPAFVEPGEEFKLEYDKFAGRIG